MSGLSSSAQKLTMAQIYVLRRMASGTVYDISGNFRRARERRTFMGNPDDVTCRSSPGPVPARPRGVMPASKPSGARFILSAQVELLRA